MNRFQALIAMFALAAAPALAQFDSAEVLGTVRDASGSVVPNAALTLLNQDTGIQAKTTADNSGNFTFSNVKIGRYRLTAEATGFSKQSESDITVNVGAANAWTSPSKSAPSPKPSKSVARPPRWRPTPANTAK